MKHIKNILKEGEADQPRKFSNEVKKHFLEIVSTYNKYQDQMDRKSDMVSIAETLGGIVEAAQQLAVNEAGNWFDRQTVKRNMNELSKLGKEFDKVAADANSLDQRLGGLYEDMGHILSRYYKLGDINEEEMKSRLGITESNIERYVSPAVASRTGQNPVGFSIFVKAKGYPVKELPKLYKTKGEAEAALKKMSVNESNKLKLTESAMSTIDVIRQESRDLKTFIKDVLKEFPELPKNKLTLKYLKDLYTQTESITEGKKRFYTQGNIGRTKYTISYHDGKKKYKDGSDFFDIKTFSNKKEFEKAEQDLKAKGYAEITGLERFNETKESVNENFTPQDIEIIKKVVAKEKKLLGLSNIFDKMGWYTDFVMLDSIPPHLKIRKKKNDKKYYLLINKRYVDDPDWVSGEIAGGLSESTEKKNLIVNESLNEEDAVDTITMDVPLFIRALEYAKEDAKTDMDLHDFAEKAIQLTKEKGIISMNNYDTLINSNLTNEVSSTTTGGYMNNHKDEYKLAQKLFKKAGGHEIEFYDELEELHNKMGHPKYMVWLSNALRGYKVDMYKNPKIKNKAEAEEALYNLSK